MDIINTTCNCSVVLYTVYVALYTVRTVQYCTILYMYISGYVLIMDTTVPVVPVPNKLPIVKIIAFQETFLVIKMMNNCRIHSLPNVGNSCYM
jgi:hypothetical protein